LKAAGGVKAKQTNAGGQKLKAATLSETSEKKEKKGCC